MVNEARELPDEGDPLKFITIYSRSIPLMDRIPDTSEAEALARLFFTNKLAIIGGTNEGISQAWKAVEISKTANIENPVTYRHQVYGTLANLYQKKEEPDSVLHVMRIIVDEARAGKNTLELTSPLNNLGVYLYQYGFSDSAMHCFLEADTILETTGGKPEDYVLLQGSVKDNLATIYEDRRAWQKARLIYKENFDFYEHTTDFYRWVNAGISWANAEIETGNNGRAKSLLDQIALAVDTLDYPNKTANELYLLDILTKYAEKIKDTENALLYMKRRMQLSDSLNLIKERQSLKVSGIIAYYTSERFGIQLEMGKQAREAEAQRARLRLYIIILIGFGALFTSITLIYYYRQRIRLQKNEKLFVEEKLRRQQNEKKLRELELENKQKDMANLALNLSQKQSWTRDLILKLDKVESAKGHQRTREMKRLKDEIKNQLYVDKNLELLQQNIDRLSHEFYDRLQKQFPNLSKTETRLSSYIKLKLTNAQIARLQNIDVESVRTSRYRLKKKLKLSSGRDLDNFLQNL